MSKRLFSTILVLAMLFVTMSWVPMLPVTNMDNSPVEQANDSPPEPINDAGLTPVQDIVEDEPNSHALAYNEPVAGVLDPVVVEQSGYAASPEISARTDSYQNLGYDLPLDVSHNWVADVAEVSAWNLEKLYAVNGTFDLGVPGVNVNPNGTIDYYPLGWKANSTDTATYGDDVQLAAYDDSGRQYVMVENQGGKVGQNAFGHDTGTRIVWTQTVQNAPYTEDFLLDFSYFYLRGPLDKNPGVPVPITGNCSITVSIDGTTVWNMSLLTLSQRGVWIDSGAIPITITGAPASFTFEIGLVIDGSLTLDKRYDYDGNGIADGIGNAAYITVYLDDVSFIKATPPTAEQVQLEFSAGGSPSALTGSLGTYYTSITNPSYWISTPVSVFLTSNTSVSFDYKTRLFSHRFNDSNWRTDVSSVGVSYTVNHGLSSDLSFYTYVGYLGGYEDPAMTILFPTDWENATVSDPFLTDLTGSCFITSGNVTIPSSIINQLGWWEVKLESPNYAKSITPQILDVGWTDNTIFRIGNTTRADITLGTNTETLGSLINVNISWFNPIDEIWASELLSGGSFGQIYSSSQVFNSGVSPAGQWWVEIYWTNGTEVAYNRARFEVHHSATLIAEPSEITSDAGSSFKGIVRYTDDDTGAYLMDPSATVEGTWSVGTVPFVAISVRNWWEADFDTSLVGAGEFVISVTASKQFYDVASCLIYIHSINVTRLTSPNAPWTAAKLGDQISLTFRYESYYSPTNSWTHIRNESDVTATVNWTAGYWSVSENRALGVYNMSLDSSTFDSGTYLLNITFSKPNHYSGTLFLTLILSPMASSLTIFNGLSSRVDLEALEAIKLKFSDWNGNPVQDTNVVIDSVSPSSGLDYTAVTTVPGETGNYSVSLTPHKPTVFTIRFLATGKNVEPAIAVFVIVVNDVSTNFEIYGPPSTEVSLSEVYNVTFRYELLNGTGIENAEIDVVYSGPIGTLSWSLPSEHGLGNYSLEFSATLPGTYVITIIAFKPFHERASSSFSLIVRNVPTHLMLTGGGSNEMGLNETYELTFHYEMYNGTGIDGASVNLVHPQGLTHKVVPLGLGDYLVQFNATLPGGYLVTISASKQYYEGNSTSFLLVVREISTHLLLSVGASEEMGLTDIYEMNFRYVMYNGTGIDGATIKVYHEYNITSHITPLGNGNYSLQINATSSGPYLITLDASAQYCQRLSASFLLTVRSITTNLVSLNGTGDFVGFGKDYRLFVEYTNGTNNGLAGATVSIAEADIGITWSPTQIEAPGIYSILLTPLTSGSLAVVVQASLANHLTRQVFFTLTVTAIPSTLTSLNVSTSISVDQNFTVYLRYQDEDLNNLENATLGILNPPQNITYSLFEDLGGGIYRITLSPENKGTYDIVFSASKAGYQTDYTGFTLSAIIIQTGLTIAGGLSSTTIKYSEQYELLLLYTRVDTGQNITDSSIRLTSGSGLDWTSTEEVAGGYRIILDPQEAGEWTIYIYAVRDNYEESQVIFHLEAERISMVVDLVSGSSAVEGVPFDLTIKLSEFDSGIPIDGAVVEYRFSARRTGEFSEMQPTGNPGEYTVRLSVPLYTNPQYRLEIKVEKENYVLLQSYDSEFTITQNVIERNSLTIRATGGAGVSLVVFFVALRIVSRRKKKQLDIDVSNKKRFDDADNIIGVIVMHKNSGIPIYSRIVKGGFEEGIVAAFISAVTHFREEFEAFSEETMQVIPISDIIRAVQTKNLICAFITIRSASIEHNRKMEAFAQQVATYLDDFYTESRPTAALDDRIAEILDYVYDETMDGNLIKFYKAADDHEFPRRYRVLQQLLEEIETRHCSRPVYLAQGVATYGVSEARGCTLVLEAIDKGYIEQCEEHEPTVEDIEFSEFFKKKNNSAS